MYINVHCLFQISILLLLNHMAIGLGYMISPCHSWSIKDETVFENTCMALTTAQLFTFIAAFSWIALDHICIHFVVAQVRHNLMMNIWLRKYLYKWCFQH